MFAYVYICREVYHFYMLNSRIDGCVALVGNNLTTFQNLNCAMSTHISYERPGFAAMLKRLFGVISFSKVSLYAHLTFTTIALYHTLNVLDSLFSWDSLCCCGLRTIFFTKPCCCWAYGL